MNKQEIENKINKMEKELADLKQELKETENEWIPKQDEEHWYYDRDLEKVICRFWDNTNANKTRL